MSQENVELVRLLLPQPELDLAALFGNDDFWQIVESLFAPMAHPDFECAAYRLLGQDKTYAGIDGMRELWLDWLTPWATYRAEIEDVIDLGDQVLVLGRSFGRLEGGTNEVVIVYAELWTVRDGKIIRYEGYPDRSEALKAVGLEA